MEQINEIISLTNDACFILKNKTDELSGRAMDNLLQARDKLRELNEKWDRIKEIMRTIE